MPIAVVAEQRNPCHRVRVAVVLWAFLAVRHHAVQCPTRIRTDPILTLACVAVGPLGICRNMDGGQDFFSVSASITERTYSSPAI